MSKLGGVWVFALAAWVAIGIGWNLRELTMAQAQVELPTEAQKTAVWSVKAGEVNIAFRNGGAAFGAVTLTLDTLRQSNPTAAQTLARDIARNLGVIGVARELGDDAIEDRGVFRDWANGTQGLPFSEADRQALIDLAKTFAVVVEP